MKTSSSLPLEQISKSLTTRWLGRTVHFYPEVDSTNVTAMVLAQQDAPEGTIVLAEKQLRGRGRGDRSWHSPPGVGIYCSVVLRPELSPAKTTLLTLMTAVAIARAVALETNLSPRIKWPNDILVNDKKIVGILLESKVGATGVEHAIIGFGINVNHTPADLPQELLAASSLFIELGEPVDRTQLLTKILAEVEYLYERLQQGDVAIILEEWRHFSATLGRHVRILQRGELTEGVAVDVTEEGALLVRVEQDSLITVHAGDIEHLRIVTDDADR
ncbi:MAG: biotin--[acetyl-CoA-carboxylase] ligase [Deltaproteobacteria bacterium]|nr:biotin--[acetyl-CoA-carboxylase] ligase [Deltaproteobacteria bacterium]